MTKETIRKIIASQEAMGRQLRPLLRVTEQLRQNELVRHLPAISDRIQEMIRVTHGPLERLRLQGLSEEHVGFIDGTARLNKLMTEIETRFQLPEITEANRLLLESPIVEILQRYQLHASKLQHAIETIRAPWLDVNERLRSIGALAELQGIGHVLRTAHGFDVRVTEAIRVDLGDWQTQIDWPASIFTNPLARSAFYEARGLDPALTAFPARAFHESLTTAGLDSPLPPKVDGYGTDVGSESDNEDSALKRTNHAHNRLTGFEMQLRKFIDEQMRAAFGDEWIKHRVPGEIKNQWHYKRQRALDNGERESPLIAYADFSDYVPIITRKDNWEEVFKPTFRRPSFVQESFQRLYPIRICTMHARLITQDDELYLYVEIKRILGAIGVFIK